MAEPNGYSHRVAELERDVKELQRGVALVPVHEQRLNSLEKALERVADMLERLGNILLNAALYLVIAFVGAIIAAGVTLIVTLT